MLLETDSLRKEFGGFTAIDDVSLSVPEGVIRSIIGPNGAGKTTLFNLLMGTLSPSASRINFKGSDITDEPAHARPYLGMSRSYQIPNIYSNKTVAENLQTAVGLFGTNYYDMFRPLKGRQSVLEHTEQCWTTEPNRAPRRACQRPLTRGQTATRDRDGSGVGSGVTAAGRADSWDGIT
jgi:ABC-type branched-subunit amino acid transport system ATPase component